MTRKVMKNLVASGYKKTQKYAVKAQGLMLDRPKEE